MKTNLLIALLFVFYAGCSGISVLNKDSTEHLYSKKFLEKVAMVKEIYRKGDIQGAILELKKMEQTPLLPIEKAYRRNLLGVIYFAQENYEQAVFNFDLGLANSRLDHNLTAQLYLNLASSYYKLGYNEKAYSTLTISDFTKLGAAEEKKYHHLKYLLSKELGRQKEMISSLIYYLGDKKKLSDLKLDTYFENLNALFVKSTKREKLKVLEDFEEKNFLVLAYLAYKEMEQTYYRGERDGAEDLLDWIKSKFSGFSEIDELVSNFGLRLEKTAKVDPGTIGVVLPLSGEKAKFGKRAMLGIDSAFRSLLGDKNYRLVVRDSEGSGVAGSAIVRELVEKEFASIIIGGLFSAEATKEYLEAKRHGAFFISLSQIYLEKGLKDHLLLEIPGSIESQVSQIFSEDFLNKFGRRAAIIYPRSERGEAYVGEFWRKATNEGVQVTGIHSYEKDNHDYREPVKKLLGLHFVRERQEELDLLTEIHSLERSKSIRRIQTLKPQIDFDWIFIPSFPKEALQLIPSFGYYDAFNLNIVGGPSWRSQSLSRESSKFGRLYFVGEDMTKAVDNFAADFTKNYHIEPRLIEMRGHDAFKIAYELASGKDFETRNELDVFVRSKEILEGITGNWKLDEGVWVKNMAPLMLRRGKIKKVSFEDVESTEAPEGPEEKK